MTSHDMSHALTLYTLVRQETTPARLVAFTCTDPIRLQGTTHLPWSVCVRLTQYARCRYAWACHVTDRQIHRARREHKLMASHDTYFAGLKRSLERGQEAKVSAP